MVAHVAYTTLDAAIIGLGCVVVAVTMISLSRSDHRWVRIWDFPRVQIVAAGGGALAAGMTRFDAAEPWVIVWTAALAGSCTWQAYRIWRYTPLHRVEAHSSDDFPERFGVRLLVANVQMDNRRVDRLRDLVARSRPDLVLLIETDAFWDRELGDLESGFAHCIRHPKDNTYGMHLFSVLDLVDPQVRYLVDRDVPSIRAGVRLRSGDVFVLYVLHPRPPPRADTTMRDAELILVGGEAKRDAAAVVAGDLNDVAWSRTTYLFQEISGLLDPRVGRGFFATFNANWRFLRWPLDHVFFSPSFRVETLAVMPSIGSDHFPLWVSLSCQPQAADRQRQPQPEASDIEEAAEIVRNARVEGQAGRGAPRE